MEISSIFVDRLYAFKYPDSDGIDEFDRLFKIWQDPEYLENFFESNKEDLQRGFFEPAPTVEEAVIITQLHAKEFERRLRKLAISTYESLDQIFKPLSENEDGYLFPRHKAYGLRHKSWLRIYALKIGHRYYVTGGAIKLTRGMKDRQHTVDQLLKIKRCFSFFEEQGISDIDGARELDL